MLNKLKTVNAYTGETIKIEAVVYDGGSPDDLSGATAKIAIRKVGSSVNTVEKSCIIDGSVIYAELSPTDTASAGSYKYEIRIKQNDEPDSFGLGDLIITQALIDEI